MSLTITLYDRQVINLRTLRPLDFDTVLESLKKTNHLVSVEHGWPQCGIGAEVVARAVEGAALDAALDDLPPATTASARVRGIVIFFYSSILIVFISKTQCCFCLSSEKKIAFQKPQKDQQFKKERRDSQQFKKRQGCC